MKKPGEHRHTPDRGRPVELGAVSGRYFEAKAKKRSGLWVPGRAGTTTNVPWRGRPVQEEKGSNIVAAREEGTS